MTHEPPSSWEMFRALGEPVRWRIFREIAHHDEISAGTLDRILPLPMPTISYHTKILIQSGLVDARKSGRTYLYRLHGETLEQVLTTVVDLARRQQPQDRTPPPPRRPRPTGTETLRRAAGDDAGPPPLPTW